MCICKPRTPSLQFPQVHTQRFYEEKLKKKKKKTKKGGGEVFNREWGDFLIDFLSPYYLIAILVDLNCYQPVESLKSTESQLASKFA